MKLSREEVLHIALLARLGLTDVEVEYFKVIQDIGKLFSEYIHLNIC